MIAIPHKTHRIEQIWLPQTLPLREYKSVELRLVKIIFKFKIIVLIISIGLPVRREIRDLQANYPDQWNLFLLGMDALQKVDENDPLSYYQIAGIHGLPYKSWDNVDGIPDFPDGSGGYCTHSSILFAPWHRPYLALMEMSLYNTIQKLVTQFPQAMQAKYVAAAKDIRLPFWDWASKSSPTFPTSISATQVTVTWTDGTTKAIPNPLYAFSFHPIDPSPSDFDTFWSQFQSTLRYPTRSKQSQENLVSRAMTNDNASLRNNISLILLSSTYQQFDAFSNNAWLQNGQPGQFGSLEDCHNQIHDLTGGPNGHMGSLDVSAFDPVFWLHHCNVDRLWAMWQDLNPNSYVTPKPSDGNFFTEPNSIEDTNSSLKPFWNTDGTDFWIPTNVKETKTFGYAYPETQSWNYSNVAQYQAALQQQINQEYGANALAEFVKSRVAAPQTTVSLAASIGAFQQKAVSHPVGQVKLASVAQPSIGASAPKPAPPVKPDAPVAAVNKPGSPEVHPKIASMIATQKYTEWVTNVRVVKHSLGQTFRVMIFLGDFNSNPETWPFEHSLVSRVTVLGRGNTNKNCDKCRADAAKDFVVTGTVSLTSALLQDIADGRLASLDKEDVVPYLQKNLHWRVSLFDGSERARDQVDGLKVGVCSTQVQIGQNGIPVYSGTYDVHMDITHGRPAGLGHGDQI